MPAVPGRCRSLPVAPRQCRSLPDSAGQPAALRREFERDDRAPRRGGAEIAELLLALNTGHEGGATTIHANGVEELPARLEALGSLAGLSADAVHSQAAAALHVVIHLRRDGPRRRVAGLGVFRRAPDGRLGVIPALTLPESSAAEPGPGGPVLAEMLRHRGITDHATVLGLP